VVELGIYKHYKGGLYRVLHIAKHTETNESLVIYRRISPVVVDGKVWARPERMFEEIINGEPRFKRIQG
jgi:hypothetical protein